MESPAGSEKGHAGGKGQWSIVFSMPHNYLVAVLSSIPCLSVLEFW
jgi:hypothetical protein